MTVRKIVVGMRCKYMVSFKRFVLRPMQNQLVPSPHNAIQKDEILPRLRGKQSQKDKAPPYESNPYIFKHFFRLSKWDSSIFALHLYVILLNLFFVFSPGPISFFLSSFRPMFLLGEMTNGHKQAIVF